MNQYTERIREIAKTLLREGRVDVVIGFRKASLPYMAEPVAITREAEADQLIFDCNCRMNLANYVTERTDNIGIVAKGCDSRNLVNHIIENKIARDQLYVIGVPCTGMADKNMLLENAEGGITEITETDGQVTIKSEGEEKQVAKADILQANCRTCIRRNPVIYDELAGDEVAELELTDRFADVDEIDAMPPEEKSTFFDNLFAACTRCYACRNACPLCYCPTCFVDESRPQWVGKSVDPVDVKTYHFLRAFHDAGRCTDCGACEAACPMDIKMRYLTRKTIKTCVDRYGWEVGMNLEDRPPLDTYSPEDPDEFIR
ncbi:MAG: 4Fe-4S dicluster domain-containing protein [Thermodesulfobacteriota bacterium]|nr:4Fe-4S dicluster domain-containing protein [Thermodesulfobacteriota bacterium]